MQKISATRCIQARRAKLNLSNKNERTACRHAYTCSRARKGEKCGACKQKAESNVPQCAPGEMSDKASRRKQFAWKTYLLGSGSITNDLLRWPHGRPPSLPPFWQQMTSKNRHTLNMKCYRQRTDYLEDLADVHSMPVTPWLPRRAVKTAGRHRGGLQLQHLRS